MQSSSPDKYSTDTFVKLLHYVERVVMLLDPDTAKEVLRNVEKNDLGNNLYNLDDPDSPMGASEGAQLSKLYALLSRHLPRSGG